LIRHTRPKIPEGVCYGGLDLDVGDTFARDAEGVRQQLKSSYSGIFVSPLIRCTTLAEHLDLAYEVDERLREMSFGFWEGIPWSDINQREIDSWAKDIAGYQVPGGERFQDVIERVDEFISGLPKGEYLLITHSGVIKACWVLFGGVSVDIAASRSIDFGGYVSIPLNSSNHPAGVLSLNEASTN
jgi:alpha-ribazole phosphatase